MKKDNLKILVLTDIDTNVKTLITNSIELSKIFDASIELFYVNQPKDIVEGDSQLSAMRSINEKYILAENKLKDMVKSISQKSNNRVTYSYEIGNIKNEIESKLNKSKPDIVVMGKRDSKRFKILGDNITDFMIKNYKGSVIIVSNTNNILPNTDLKLGIFNSKTDYYSLKYMDKLLLHSSKPLVSFCIQSKKKTETNNSNIPSTNILEYTFEDNVNVMSNIKTYINKSAVNLLCLENTRKKDFAASVNKVLDKVDVSVMMSPIN